MNAIYIAVLMIAVAFLAHGAMIIAFEARAVSQMEAFEG